MFMQFQPWLARRPAQQPRQAHDELQPENAAEHKRKAASPAAPYRLSAQYNSGNYAAAGELWPLCNQIGHTAHVHGQMALLAPEHRVEAQQGTMMIADKFLAAALLAAVAVPALADPAPATLSVSASADVDVAPDTAVIGAGVVTEAADAGAALAENTRRMNAVIAALRKAGVAATDIRTDSLSLQPKYHYQQNEAPRLSGFEASNQVRVTLRDVQRTGAVVDALVAAGANRVDGPTFTASNADALLDGARVRAVETARRRADLYAKAAGLRVARVLTIAENGARPPATPVLRAMAVQASPAPVEAGAINMSVSVTMQFELAPR